LQASSSHERKRTGFSADLKPKKLITATNDKVNVKFHSYDNIPLATFMAQLSERLTKRDPEDLDIKRAIYGCVHKPARYSDKDDGAEKHAMKKVRTGRLADAITRSRV
jgi:TPP-dependent 2-oxoacid decarboxylase